MRSKNIIDKDMVNQLLPSDLVKVKRCLMKSPNKDCYLVSSKYNVQFSKFLDENLEFLGLITNFTFFFFFFFFFFKCMRY